MSAPQTPIVDVNDPLQREVAVRVGRAWREIRRGASMGRLIEYLFGAGDDALEIGQMDTLDLLVQQPAWRMGDLAEALRVDPSTATRAVQRLEKFGLAERCSGVEDKRVVMVSASEFGRQRHAAAASRREELMNYIMSTFGQGELEKMASTLEQFIGAIDDFVDGLPSRPPGTSDD
jgi:DNA-binding MarR family transcriptional regulator